MSSATTETSHVSPTGPLFKVPSHNQSVLGTGRPTVDLGYGRDDRTGEGQPFPSADTESDDADNEYEEEDDFGLSQAPPAFGLLSPVSPEGVHLLRDLDDEIEATRLQLAGRTRSNALLQSSGIRVCDADHEQEQIIALRMNSLKEKRKVSDPPFLVGRLSVKAYARYPISGYTCAPSSTQCPPQGQAVVVLLSLLLRIT